MNLLMIWSFLNIFSASGNYVPGHLPTSTYLHPPMTIAWGFYKKILLSRPDSGWPLLRTWNLASLLRFFPRNFHTSTDKPSSSEVKNHPEWPLEALAQYVCLPLDSLKLFTETIPYPNDTKKANASGTPRKGLMKTWLAATWNKKDNPNHDKQLLMEQIHKHFFHEILKG